MARLYTMNGLNTSKSFIPSIVSHNEHKLWTHLDFYIHVTQKASTEYQIIQERFANGVWEYAFAQRNERSPEKSPKPGQIKNGANEQTNNKKEEAVLNHIEHI